MKKLKVMDWILLVILVASLIGCIVEFQKRYLLIYYCLPAIFSIFFLVERRIIKGRMKILKMFALLMATMFVIYCAFIFYSTSTPAGMVRDQGSEIYLAKMDCFEEVSIPSMNGNIDGWLYKQSDKKSPLIIFFNGAGECSAETVRNFHENGILSEYFPDSNFLCTDYPSYGISDGFVSESSMKEMALDTYDTAIQWDFIDKSKISVVAYSIGTGPASYLAAHRDLTSLVMLAPYEKFLENSIRNAEREAATQRITKEEKFSMGVERIFYSLLWGYNVDPYDYAKSIEEPVLIISSMDDTTIIHEASMKVADRLKNCKVITLTGIKHEHLLCDTSYKAINEFLYR